MTRAAIFVDLPNFYSHLLRSGIEEPRFLRDYFLHWLDFDLLARALTGPFSGVWVFYSGERIGPSNERVAGQHLREYVDRINALTGVTARDVNIQGEQREPIRVQCEKCGAETVGEWISEKGVDASLIVHMFDTMDSWDIAFLLSGDADYVPVVTSLRRRGKIVNGAGFPNCRASALVRECYDYIDLCDVFLKQDIAAYAVFKEDGLAQAWLTDEVHCKADPRAIIQLAFTVSWDEEILKDFHVVSFSTKGAQEDDLGANIELSDRNEKLERFEASYPDQVYQRWLRGFIFHSLVWIGVERRMDVLAQAPGLHYDRERGLLEARYQYHSDVRRYEMQLDQEPSR